VPRIEDSLIQDEIASSLLSPAEQAEEQAGSEQEESEFAASGADLLDEAISEQQSERLQFDEGDSAVERWRAEHPDEEARQEQPPERLRSERAPQEQESEQQAAEPSPQQVQEVIQQLDTASEQFQLNEGSREFADKMAPLLGPEIYKNEALLSNTVSRYTLAARDAVLATNGDLTQLPPLSRAMGHEAARAVAVLFDMNPQENPVYDEMHVANTMRFAFANLINTYVQSGGKTDVTELNDKQMAVWVVQNLAKGLTGTDEPVNPKWAIQFTNAIAGRVLPLLPKIKQGFEGAGQPRQTRARGQRVPAAFREGMKGAKAPRFGTNSGPDDPFDAKTMQTYYERTARL